MADHGHLKPDSDLTEVFTRTVRDVSPRRYGSVSSGANTALLVTLRAIEDEHPDAVAYHLQQLGYDDLDDLQDAVHDRQEQDFLIPDLLDVDVDHAVSMDDSAFDADLKEPDDDHDGTA